VILIHSDPGRHPDKATAADRVAQGRAGLFGKQVVAAVSAKIEFPAESIYRDPAGQDNPGGGVYELGGLVVVKPHPVAAVCGAC
jgi:hypothetical protein